MKVDVTIHDEELLIEQAVKSLVDKMYSSAEKKLNTKQINDSVKSLLVNKLQLEISNRILDEIDMDSIVKNASKKAEDLANKIIMEKLKGTLTITFTDRV